MNDDIFRPDGADWIEPARPPVAPTVNVSATDGFAIDGTDGFAIDEGPIETPVEAPSTDPDGMPALSRGRLVATVAAALTGLLVVILVGSSTGPRPVVSDAGVLRTDDSVTTTTGPVESTPEGAWTRSLLGLWGSTAFAPVYEFDESGEFATDYETVPYDTVYPTEFETDFDSQFDTSFDTDFEDSGTFTYNTIPPRRLPVFSTPSRTRFPPPRRLLPTTPPITSSPTESTTAPTESTTTTVPEPTTTTVPPTTTTTKPTPQWVAATNPDPDPTVQCPDGLKLWARPGAMLAAVPGNGLFASTDRGTTWTGPVAGAGDKPIRAFVQHPDVPDTFWVGGDEGVFETVDGGGTFTALGAPSGVQSMSVRVSGVTTTAFVVAGTQPTLYRRDGTEWPAVTLPTGAGTPVHPLVMSAPDVVLLGTSTGVWRTTDGGRNWSSVFAAPSGIVGAPVVAVDGTISWLVSDGQVIRSTDGGVTWIQRAGTGAGVASLTQLPDGRLLAVGEPTLVTLPSNGQGAWQAFGPTLEFAPAGVAYSPEAKATFIWKGTCGADAVMRLDDV